MPLLQRLGRLLRDPRGPFMRERELERAGFGIGRVPGRLKPDATTRIVCGFCSTGCSLDVHLQNGVAINVSPTVDPARIPPTNSLAYDQIVEGIYKRKIRGLWVVATNSAHSWINQADLCDILATLDFLVVQDMYATTETAERAHLVLPAAGWGEKEGTFINSERRIGVIKRVSRAPGEALADFYIFKLIAEAWGCGEMFRRWSTPEDVFRMLAEVTRGAAM
jgi:predicted molibdopterin-dependent oxidoreductase YjgC